MGRFLLCFNKILLVLLKLVKSGRIIYFAITNNIYFAYANDIYFAIANDICFVYANDNGEISRARE